MPIIEFEGPNGDRIEQFHHIPVDEVVVEGQVYRRAIIPSKIQVNVGAEPLAQRDQVKQGCYAHECSQKPWNIKYSKNQVKRIWGI